VNETKPKTIVEQLEQALKEKREFWVQVDGTRVFTILEGKRPTRKQIDQLLAGVEHASGERRRRLEIELERARSEEKRVSLIIEKSDEVTFELWLQVYLDARFGGRVLKGLEFLVGSTSMRSYRSTNNWYWQLKRADQARNEENWETKGGMGEWRVLKHDPEPGPLFDTKLKDITPEMCFIEVEDGGKRVLDRTSHSRVRSVLEAAIKVGILEENPASTKKTKAKA
jgi:hypothetical protein